MFFWSRTGTRAVYRYRCFPIPSGRILRNSEETIHQLFFTLVCRSDSLWRRVLHWSRVFLECIFCPSCGLTIVSPLIDPCPRMGSSNLMILSLSYRSGVFYRVNGGCCDYVLLSQATSSDVSYCLHWEICLSDYFVSLFSDTSEYRCLISIWCGALFELSCVCVYCQGVF